MIWKKGMIERRYKRSNPDFYLKHIACWSKLKVILLSILKILLILKKSKRKTD